MDFDNAPDESQSQAQEPIHFDSAPDESLPQGAIHFDSAPDESQQAPQRTLPQEIGRDLRTGARAILPTTAAILGGLGAGAVGAVAGPGGALAGGIVGGAAAGFAAQKAQDTAADWLGVDSEASRAADAANPSIASTAAEFAPAALSLNVGKLAGNLTERLAQRLLTGGIMGAVDLGTQAATKGTDNIDPTEAALAAGTGAVLGKVKPWAANAVEGGLGTIGADAAAARSRSMYQPTGEAAPAKTPGVDIPEQSTPQQGAGNGNPPGGAQVNKNAIPDPAEAQRVDSANDLTKVSTGTAEVNDPVTGSKASTEPDPNLDIAAKPNVGFQSGRGTGTDYGKDIVAANEAGIPGAESTPLVTGEGGPLDDPAIRGAMPDDGSPLGVGDQRGLMGGTPPEPTPPRPPQEVIPAQAARPAAAQAAIEGRRPVETPEQRNALIDQIFPKKPGPPDLTGLEPTPKAPSEGQKPIGNTSGKMEDIPDFLKRTPKQQAQQPQEPENERLKALYEQNRQQQQNSPNQPMNLAAAHAKINESVASDISDILAKDAPGATQEAFARQPPAAQKAIAAGPVDRIKQGLQKSWLGQLAYPTGVSPSSEAAGKAILRARGADNQVLLGAAADAESLYKPINQATPEQQTELMHAVFNNGKVSTPALEPVANTLKAINDRVFKDAAKRLDIFDATDLVDRMPVTKNPIEAVMSNVRQLHALTELNAVAKDGLAESWLSPKKEMPDWEKIIPEGLPKGKELWGPPEVAQLFKNAYTNGYRDTQPAGKIFNAMQKSANIMTQTVLGVNGFHAFMTAQQGIISQAALGIEQLAAGRVAKGLTRIASAPAAPFTKPFQNKEFVNAFLDPNYTSDKYPNIQKIVQAAKDANWQPIGHNQDQTTSFVKGGYGDNWFRSFTRGTLADELKNSAANLTGKSGIGAAAGEPFHLLGKTMQTVMMPLFEKYIPAMKNAAVMDRMGAWIDEHQQATREEMADQMILTSKSMDNRFGLLNYDNNFWNPFIKQTGQVLFLAPGYNVGNIREIPGGVLSGISHPSRMSIASKDADPRIAYNIGMALTWGLIGATYQYLKTGELPKDTADYLGPRTGGKTTGGLPERMAAPGYQNDIMKWMTDPKGALSGKLNPAVKTAMEFMSNKDFKDQPIMNPQDPLYNRWAQFAGHVVDSMTPISLKTARQGPKPGSNMSTAERVLGQTRPQSTTNAALYPDSPGKIAADKRAWEAKTKYDRKQEEGRTF